MREYIATKSFYSGELDQYVQKDERIKFDGVKAEFRGEDKKAPSLMSAIRAGILSPAQVTSLGKSEEDASIPQESASERAKKAKEARLMQIRGSAGNGQFLEDTEMKKVDKRIVKSTVDEKETEIKKDKKVERPIVQETEGVEVAKVTKNAVVEDEHPKSFYENLMEGQTKKLEVAKDQFVPKVIKKDSQDDAIEVKSLVDSEMTASKDPLKNWSSLNAKKKATFIKNASDSAVIKQIISKESGSIKRKAEEKLAEINGDKGLR
jgi:hypothetical protein